MGTFKIYSVVHVVTFAWISVVRVFIVWYCTLSVVSRCGLSLSGGKQREGPFKIKYFPAQALWATYTVLYKMS